MIELSRTQDEEVGDGTTSVIILGDLFHLLFWAVYNLITFMQWFFTIIASDHSIL